MTWNHRTVLALLAACILVPAQEPETVKLPRAINATEPDRDRSRIILTIPEPAYYQQQTGKDLDKSGIPILVEGRQARSLDHLRAMLKELADPAKHPDTKTITPDGMPPVPLSSRTVFIRCDREQHSGWVLAVMGACTMHTGEDFMSQIRSSPMVYRIEIAVQGGRVLATDLPVDGPLIPENDTPFNTNLVVAASDRIEPATERRVSLRASSKNELIGAFTGIEAVADGGYALKSDPPDLGERYARHLAEAGGERRVGSVKIAAAPQVPFAYLAELIGLARSDGRREITYFGLSTQQLEALQAGQSR